MIKLNKISCGYGSKEVLHDISLLIPANKTTAVLGPNGCGKSTLLKSIIKLLNITKGEILINNKDLNIFTANELSRYISYLPQNKEIPDIPVMRMVLNGRFPYLKYPRRYTKADFEIVENILKKLNLHEYKDLSIKKLSGGIQQKVFIAMALAQDTPVILLDEPTSFLDISHQIEFMELTKLLAEEGKTILMVLHDITLTMKYCDNIIIMNDGKISGYGTPKEIYNNQLINKAFDINLMCTADNTGLHYYY